MPRLTLRPLLLLALCLALAASSCARAAPATVAAARAARTTGSAAQKTASAPTTVRAGEEDEADKDKDKDKDKDYDKDKPDLNFKAIIGILTPVLIVLAVCVVFVCCLRTGDKAVAHLEARAESRRQSVDLHKREMREARASVDSGFSVPLKPGGRASIESGMSLPPATASSFSVA